VEVQQDFFLDCEAEAARHERPGRYTARLAGAGSALMMPDLIQNIADRPLDEVLFFFGELKRLPLRPTVESLRDVLSWYKDGFLDDMSYEDDPVGAWAKCGSSPLHLLLVSPRRRDLHLTSPAMLLRFGLLLQLPLFHTVTSGYLRLNGVKDLKDLKD
jgi:hypothetical protein